jgi:hypothetical protein
MYDIAQSRMGLFPVHTPEEMGGITTNQKMPEVSDCAGGF